MANKIIAPCQGLIMDGNDNGKYKYEEGST
jgi:hypothetical protein